MAKTNTVLDDKLHWYKDAIIYELHIKAFCDSNGDGIGDFGGLLQKLDYLQELGVTAIWVLPFYPSPLKDDGYDIADYYSINPSYGTIEQFKQFLEEAHKRNLKVITELVINHTSDQHPWFQRARKAPKGSPERDFYVWTDDPTRYKDVRIIFQDFETSNWTWDPIAQQYYWHRFFHHQPDLNYDNPQVQEEIFKILDYWCAMGVDGFRLDAVPYLFEREGTNGENLPETHAFLKKLRKHIDEHYPGTAFLAEANMWPEDSASYFGDGDECHMNYHFPVMPRMFMALQREDRYPITDIFDQTPPIPETCQWAMFLRNHDELTLEMVTDEERDYMYKMYAKDPKARINLGIRHRLAPLMDNSRRKIELMNSLLFSLPGTPVIYYGDEIGMGDNYYLGDRDGVRTPMQWSPDRNAGFSSTNPHRLYLPVIMDPEYHYETVNVEVQRRNTSSLFWFMRQIINMRKQHKAFSRGDMQFLNVDNPKVLAFTRSYEEETILVIVNLSKYAQPAEMDLSAYKGFVPVEVFSKNRFPAIKEGSPYFFTLSPHSYQWFVLQKVHPELGPQEAPPVLHLADWSELGSDAVKQQLENTILPDYLPKTSWFFGKKRTIYTIAVTDAMTVPLPRETASFLLLEVTYESGLPETYFLPVAFARDKNAAYILANCPQAVLATVIVGGQEGVLCDALYENDLQQLLFNKLVSGQSITDRKTTIAFNSKADFKKEVQPAEEVKAKVHVSERMNTAINYDNRFLLKLYRKEDRSINPDVEMARFLSEEVQFPYTPVFMGSVEWRQEGSSIVLGQLQQFVENHGDNRTFMLERINNYIERILAHNKGGLPPQEHLGSLSRPVSVEQLPEDLRTLLGGTAPEQAKLLGVRTAELHLALASNNYLKDFTPEEYSLHYQRSLFSSMQSLVRESYQNLNRHLRKLPDDVQQQAQEIITRRDDLLNTFKRIYRKKLDVKKIRIHGAYRLSQVLLTGKDVAFADFSGNPFRSFSERRIKRSPLRDVATMVHSFYYVAYEGFFNTSLVQKKDLPAILPYAELWAFYMGQFFLQAYLEAVQGQGFVPEDQKDFDVLFETFLLEIALYTFNYELNNRPEWAMIPLRIITYVLREHEPLMVQENAPE